MTGTCPPDDDLLNLLAGRMTAGEEQTLEAHVGGCAGCQSRLDQLTQGPPLFSPVVEYPEAGTRRSPLSGDFPERLARSAPARISRMAQVARRPPASDVDSSHFASRDTIAAIRKQLSSPSASSPPQNSSRRSRLGRSVNLQTTGRFFRRQFWTWPIIAAVLLAGVGWWVHSSLEGALGEQRANELTTIRDADVAALRVWMDNQRAMAGLMASDEALRELIARLAAEAADDERSRTAPTGPRDHSSAGAVGSGPAQIVEAIRERLAGPLQQTGFIGFVLVSPSGRVLADNLDTTGGPVLSGYRLEFLRSVLEGGTAVSRPFRSPLLLADAQGVPRAGLPCMYAAAAVRDAGGKPLAVLGLRIRPEDEFTRILQVARSGKSGETYAFDRRGLLLSQSRFDEDLKQIGLLTDQPDSQSILTIEIRDPGVNMAEGERPAQRRPDQPLTRMAAAAVGGHSGYDVDGYRDYRGVPVVGAWEWLDEYGFGVATEIDVAEAFRPAHVLRRTFAVLMGLLLVSAAGMLVATLVVTRQQRALLRATLAASQLGQYTLIEEIGSGGMGTVYKARHALLRRPTAIKLLNTNIMSSETIARFEREVQLTSGLTHPHTVMIFDYGHTPEGIFYYAMEYLDGLDLHDLVRQHGPLPEARVVFILRQVCESLAEAHAAGLVHRDVKPANIVLTRRGGLYDFVKVVDFGLVKALDNQDEASVTSPNSLAGTPLFLSPEAVNRPNLVDARSDVYALGAVTYFLLTGTPVFRGATVLETCIKHAGEQPEPPSSRLGRPVSPDLERLVLRCLAKSQAGRPADAAELLRELEACHVTGQWTAADAADWWEIHDRAESAIADGENVILTKTPAG